MKKFKIPLRLINLNDDGFHLLMEVVVFKKMHYAVLDTGASRSVFDKALLEEHLPTEKMVNEDISAATLFTSTTTIQAQIPYWKIGKLKIKKYEAVAFDLQSVSQTYEQFGHPPISCIVGGDILMEYKAKIDYKKLMLVLRKK
ncbi:hypothetical protein ABIB40_001863 [Pedobacter sp. UYP30]|uniref:retropepsin-like aspartic protease n=1 Tax=Pedobacter sp. UYP30 TaxID=1756400 RepID=UPI0033910ED2